MDKERKVDNMVCFDQWKEASDAITAERSQTEPIRRVNRSTWFSPGLSADFAYVCDGYCMEPTFYSGEYVFIHQQESFSDGQVGAVRIGSELMLKRLYHLPDGFLLVPDNKRYKPLKITGNDAENVKVIGIAVARKGRSEQ